MLIPWPFPSYCLIIILESVCRPHFNNVSYWNGSGDEVKVKLHSCKLNMMFTYNVHMESEGTLYIV